MSIRVWSVLIAILLVTLTLYGVNKVALTASTPGRHFGFGWLTQPEWYDYSPGSFFNAYFLTPPYPSTVVAFIPGIAEDISHDRPFSMATATQSQLGWWQTVLTSADSHPNIQITLMLNVNMTSLESYQLWQYFVDGLRGHPSLYSIGINGEFSTTTNSSAFDQYGKYVIQDGKQFISRYLYGLFWSDSTGTWQKTSTSFTPQTLLPTLQGSLYVGNVQWPHCGNYALETTYQDSYDVGISAGYGGEPWVFPETRPLPPLSTDFCTVTPSYGWNQQDVSMILKASLNVSSQYRQFLDLGVGWSGNESFVGVSGQTTTLLWDNPTLRNWIWTDPNYRENFVTSNGSSPSTSSTTSISSTTSFTSPITSFTITSTTSMITSTSQSTSRTTSSYSSSMSGSSTTSTSPLTVSTSVTSTDSIWGLALSVLIVISVTAVVTLAVLLSRNRLLGQRG